MVGRPASRFSDALIRGLLLLVGGACVFPLLFVVSVSLTPLEEVVRRGGIVVVPTRVTFEAYRLFLSMPLVISAYWVTTVITVVGTAINVALTVLMAYPLSNPALPGNRQLMLFVLVPMVLAPGIIPTYLVVKATGLMNTLWALMIPGAVWSYVLIITRSFFMRIDRSMFEAARMDGARESFVLTRVALPLSMPIIATISLFYGVGHWNEYFGGVLYISEATKRPLQVVLRSILINAERLETDLLERTLPSETLKMAAVVVAAAPVIVVYPFLQRYFTQGIMIGAIKG